MSSMLPQTPEVKVPMCKTGLIAAAALLMLCSTAQADSRTGAVDDVLERASFQGVVMAADRSGTFYSQARGIANRANATPHDVESVWRWASVTKQLTAVLIMQHVDAGELSLDTALADALPEFTGGNRAKITIRHLLQHTSGLPNPDQTPPAANGVPSFYTEGFPVGNAWCNGPSTSAPGERFAYNNCDYLLLGRILEQRAKTRYSDLVREKFAAGLKLDSVAVVDANRAPRSIVTGYRDDGTAAATPALKRFGAAGAIEGVPADMLTFDRALIDGKLLSDRNREILWTGEPKFGYAALGAWAFTANIRGCADGVRLIERRGEIGGIQVRNFIARDLGVALVLFSNTDATDFGEVWMAKGLSHDVLSAALCAT